MDELFNQTRAVFVNDPIKPEQVHQADRLQRAFRTSTSSWTTGATKEEWKMSVETRKILDPDIEVHATCVRVPVFISHSEAVNVEFDKPVDEKPRRARLLSKKRPA